MALTRDPSGDAAAVTKRRREMRKGELERIMTVCKFCSSFSFYEFMLILLTGM
jgi:hypothetical protein